MEKFIIILLLIVILQYFAIKNQLTKVKNQNHFLIIKTKNMSQTQEEAAQALAAVSAQLTKAKGEIVAKIQTLIDAAANAANVDPTLQAAIDDLAPIAQALDDIVPDPPVEPPVGGDTGTGDDTTGGDTTQP